MPLVLNRKGFTLLEMMVTLLILAVVLTTLFASYNITFRTITGSERIAAIYDNARVALERMGDDIEGACLPMMLDEQRASSGIGTYDKSFVGEEKLDDGRRADRLSFVSHSHARLRSDDLVFGLAKISYFVRPEEQGKGFTLYREEFPLLSRASSSSYGMLPLCEGLYSFKLSYFDETGRQSDHWDFSEGSESENLPVMVSITLSFIDDGDMERPIVFFTSMPISSRAEPNDESSKR